MTKKIIAIISTVGVLALGGGAFAIGKAMNTPATADTEFIQKPVEGLLTELKTGKYYLENGTDSEYIEVFEDGTLQVFGLDYLKLVSDLNADWIASLNDEEYKEFVAAEQDLVDFWNSKHYYWLSEYVKSIHLDDELPEPGQLGSKSGLGLIYTDENTLIWDDDHIYKFAE